MEMKNIPYLLSLNFSISIGETCTCLTCNTKKSPKILKEFVFILPLEEISKKGKNTRKTSHEKKTHLGKSCVTMTDFMEIFYETTELSDVICDNCTKSSLTTRNPIYKKNGI